MHTGNTVLGAVSRKAVGLTTTLQVRVNTEMLERIDRAARETRRKRSDVMRLLMVAGLEQHEAERRRGK